MAEVKTLTDANREEIRTIYTALDKNRDGKIVAKEMAEKLRTFNGVERSPLSEEEANDLLHAMDFNGDGTVSLLEFEAMCGALIGVFMSKHDLVNYYKKFADSDQCIKRDDLRSIMLAFTIGGSEMIDEQLDMFDKDGDGKISTHEFEKALPVIMGEAVNYEYS